MTSFLWCLSCGLLDWWPICSRAVLKGAWWHWEQKLIITTSSDQICGFEISFFCCCFVIYFYFCSGNKTSLYVLRQQSVKSVVWNTCVLLALAVREKVQENIWLGVAILTQECWRALLGFFILRAEMEADGARIAEPIKNQPSCVINILFHM